MKKIRTIHAAEIREILGDDGIDTMPIDLIQENGKFWLKQSSQWLEIDEDDNYSIAEGVKKLI